MFRQIANTLTLLPFDKSMSIAIENILFKWCLHWTTWYMIPRNVNFNWKDQEYNWTVCGENKTRQVFPPGYDLCSENKTRQVFPPGYDLTI